MKSNPKMFPIENFHVPSFRDATSVQPKPILAHLWSCRYPSCSDPLFRFKLSTCPEHINTALVTQLHWRSQKSSGRTWTVDEEVRSHSEIWHNLLELNFISINCSVNIITVKKAFSEPRMTSDALNYSCCYYKLARLLIILKILFIITGLLQ